MKISVILANFNGAAFLGETLESVANQTRPPDELIVVDDASTDRSGEVIEDALVRFPFFARLIRHPHNRGQAAGFNTGFAATAGDLVCLLDSDDLWHPRKLAAVEEVAEREPSAALIHHQMKIVQGTEWTDEDYLAAQQTGDVFKLWVTKNVFPLFAPTSGLAIRSEVLRKILPVPERMRISADSYVTRTAICHGPAIAIREALGGYRRHDRNHVFGRTDHNAYHFFLQETRPLLHAYYVAHGLPSPVAHLENAALDLIPPPPPSLGDRLLDLSLRSILRRFGWASQPPKGRRKRRHDPT